MQSHQERDRYTGERREQLRHGHGIYSYTNRFFKYQGQWENGLKHGHGRLSMGDGGFYEGTFERGEIEGHGYRFYGLTGDSYTGQFHNGERHGQGVLKTVEGSLYEGTWVHGKMEVTCCPGTGILTERDGSVYEGEFHNNRKHGEGVQTYSPIVYYEGGWIAGKRHGHGLFRAEDGSVYNGQWREDQYHGEGSITHSSGVTYTGMWIKGRPATEPILIKQTDSSTEVTVEQGKPFTLCTSLVDKEGSLVVLESGRTLAVQAGISKATPKKRPLLSKTSTMPNFNSFQPYDLLQVPQPNIKSLNNTTEATPEDIIISTLPPTNPSVLTPVIDKPPYASKKLNSIIENDELHTSSMVLLRSSLPSSPLQKLDTPLSSPETKSLFSMNKVPADMSKEEEFLSTLVPPSKVLVKNGIALFKDLFLPPPPPTDLNILVPSSKTVSTKEAKSVFPINLSDASASNHKHKAPDVSSSQSSRGSKVTIAKSNSRLLEREKLLHTKPEKFCTPGTYIIKVSEVTDPPFLGTRLPDLLIQVKVLPQKGPTSVSLNTNKSKGRA